MFNDLDFLSEGEYTQSSPLIRKLSREIIETGEPLKGISNRIRDLCWIKSPTEFRKRSGAKILSSNYVTGCTDRALAFIVLARALGIPARYVETFNENWLESDLSDGIEGHVFTDVFVDGKWKIYEPVLGTLKVEDYFLGNSENKRRYIDVGKGLDFSEVYLGRNGKYFPNPTKIDSVRKLREIAKLAKNKIRLD